MSAIHPTYTTENRILGCLYGQAIGDAMGMPSELWPKRRIINHFGWIERFLPDRKRILRPANFAPLSSPMIPISASHSWMP